MNSTKKRNNVEIVKFCLCSRLLSPQSHSGTDRGPGRRWWVGLGSSPHVVPSRCPQPNLVTCVLPLRLMEQSPWASKLRPVVFGLLPTHSGLRDDRGWPCPTPKPCPLPSLTALMGCQQIVHIWNTSVTSPCFFLVDLFCATYFPHFALPHFSLSCHS